MVMSQSVQPNGRVSVCVRERESEREKMRRRKFKNILNDDVSVSGEWAFLRKCICMFAQSLIKKSFAFESVESVYTQRQRDMKDAFICLFISCK